MTGELLAFLGSGAVVAFITALITGLFQRRKTNAEADVTISKAWQELLRPYQEQIAYMQTQITELRTELFAIREENMHVKADLRTAQQSVGVLERRERVMLVRQAESATWEQVAVTAAAEHGIDLPPPPRVMPLRDERTRRTDQPDSHDPKENW